MVKKCCGLGPSEHPAELDLPPGRTKEIVAADDERDALTQVVNHRRELVGPVPVTVAQQQIAALRRRSLGERAVAQVVERLVKVVQRDADAEPGFEGQLPFAA